MSIVKSYRDQFNIFIFDQDFGRCESLAEVLRQAGYKYATFTEQSSLLTAVPNNLPHVLLVFYQPLSVEFRKLLKSVRELSLETEIVILGSGDFWPGIKNLLDHGLANDFWAWPFASHECLRLRLDQFVEKTIYKYISEQKSEKTAEIVKRIEDAEEIAKIKIDKTHSSSFDVYQLPTNVKTESRLIDDLVQNLKTDYSECEFAFLKYYAPKQQLLVYKTSFSADGYTRGQFFSYPDKRREEDKKQSYSHLHETVRELFISEDYKLYPVDFADNLYGFLVGFHVSDEDSPLVEKAVRYVALTMRNLQLEKTKHDPKPETFFKKNIEYRSFFEAISREVSRARRIYKPVSLLLAHAEFRGEQDSSMKAISDYLESTLRVYDFFSKISENEIAIVLPHTGYENAAIKAERMRRALLTEALKTQNPPLRLCFGVAEFPNLAHGTDDLLDAAKAACDQVLAAGKNKVCLFTQKEDFEPEFRV